MSETTTTTMPTAWFLAVYDDDPSGYSAAARIRPPMVAERWDADTGSWVVAQTNLWETLQEDPGWEQVTEADVEAWIASRQS